MNAKKTITILTAIIASTLIISSCSKEGNYHNPSLFSPSGNIIATIGTTNIPSYSDYDELLSVMENAIAYDSIDDLLALERNLHFKSIGALSDSLYIAIISTLPDDESTTTQSSSTSTDPTIVSNIINNYYGTLIDTTMSNGEVSITPIFFQTPYRYVANVNGLFSVGEECYRLFRHSIVSTSIDNLDELIELSENDLEELDTFTFHQFSFLNESPTDVDHNGCSNMDNSDTLTINKDRVILGLVTSAIRTPMGNSYATFIEHKVHTYSQHKCLGIWWTSRHTMTVQGNVTLHKLVELPNTWSEESFNIQYHHSTNGKWILYDSYPTPNYYADCIHYFSYNITSRTPGVASAFLSL